MTNLNDFKLLNIKCKTYFNILENALNKTIKLPSEGHKEKFGFYLFMLESLCNIKDVSDIVELITDTEFNSAVFDKKDEDYGIDAIFIDDENNYINLFNFKFRANFNSGKQQSINETFLSTKFTNAIISENISGLSGKIEILSKIIIEKLSSNDVWNLRLYVVSNEPKDLDINSTEIKQLKELYDLETVPIGLDAISKIMSIRPAPIDAVLHIDKDLILPFVESSLSSSKSYVIRVCANDLIRITCNNAHYREDYKMEDFSVLFNTEMEYGLLFDNVRGLVMRSKFNDNILKTLKEESSKFFMYNNGLTLTANDVIAEDTNAKQKVKITIKNFQVVNGGQTLRTIHKFNQLDSNNITSYLSNCELLLRVFKTPTESKIRNRIAEYTNSQNAISIIDLKSLSAEQIQIEQFLEQHNIIYARKTGDTGISPTKDYSYKISMEKFGQILYSIQGNPEKASNQKKLIFEKHYSTVFGEQNFDISKSAIYVKRYFEIKKEYDLSDIYESTDQKLFYILYIDNRINARMSLDDQIELLENTLKTYIQEDQDLTDSRKLLSAKFKEKIDQAIMKYNDDAPIG